ncbi:MAG: tRNA threonylcarbamoyladenosine biosynthesis protein RimN [Alteromonadaceae bacterium]|nr:MAG: tRNA threonylcarbamoyladenosine biosynthesis protein RimN [Alteromonadaceae bacterium]
MIHCGHVAAYPTEAVWGLGCDPNNDLAIEQILQLKGRSWKKGLILVAASIGQFDFILDKLPDGQYRQLDNSWPGHITWLVPHHNLVSSLISGVHSTVALRVSDHPVVKALCEHLDSPIVSTSANPQGLPAPKSALEVRRYFRTRKPGGNKLCICPGVIGGKTSPSLIKDLASGKVIR